MANTSFYGLTGTTATVQNTIQTSVTAAKTSETNAAASAAAALLSKNAAAASATTAQSGLGTIASSVATTNTNATNTAANAVSTAADAVQTAADRVQTGLDRTSVTSSAATVASSAAQVTTDAAQVAADRIQTGTDAATASAAAAATAGVTASAAQVATDAAQVATDAAQVAVDRIQTGLDASNLSTSVTSAQTAQAAAESALDQFTDQYLGPKASVPTTDNDGNALVSGALVFDTTAGAMKVWDGSAWTAAYISASGSGALLTANDLSDLSSASSARVNLGLGSAATTASTDYATAAQGALAATATQPADNISTLTNDSGFTTYTADQAVDTTSSPSFVTVNGRDVAADGTKLDTIETSATADQTGAEIKTAYEAEANTNAFTDAEKTKLTAIETSATADQTGAEIKAAYEAEANTNAYTDAEKTKLTAIEAGATADQTGAEIKTAYEAQANTNAYTDAEKTKLTGIEAGADVTDATNVAAAGALMTTGGSVTGDVSFGDNDKAIFGAGSDLQIYHSGGASHIDDVGTGDFKISTDGAGIYLNKGGSENMASFLTDGAVTLYYDNAAKLATKATGAQINGQLDVQNTAGNVVTGVRATEFGYSSTYQVTQVGDTSGNKSVSIAYDPSTNASGSFTGNGSEVLFRNGVEFMTPNSGNTGFHNNVLVMKDGNIGIGTASPTRTFEVTDGTSGKIRASGTAGGFLECWDGTYGVYFGSGLAISGSGNSNDSILWTEGGGAQRFLSSGLERMRIDSSGRVTMPSQPAFHAHGTSTSWTVFSNGGWSTIVLPATTFNTGNHYNTASSAFTAPVTGVYHFYYKIYGRVQSGAPASTYWQSRFQKNNSAISGHGAMIMAYYYNDGGKDETATYSMTISLAANDQITLHAVSAGAYNGEYYPINCEFGGYLIG